MITDDMMLYRLFNRVCQNHLVTIVSYRSKSTTMTVASSYDYPVTVKVLKFRSIDDFIFGIAQVDILRMRFRICMPVRYKNDRYAPSFLLETAEGELEVIFRNS